MNYQEYKTKIDQLKLELSLVDSSHKVLYKNIEDQISSLQEEMYQSLTPYERVMIARNINRPKALDYINALFTNFIELHGDYLFADDNSLIGGIAYFNKTPITILAQAKGKNLQENIERNFGSTNPEGFRKAKRLALQAEKFNRPIITIVDTSGAYPGKGAEERGQARAIADSLMTFSTLRVPVICIVIGEGGSGGALALSVADRIVMLENAVYSILSPEGFASILFKDVTKASESANKMKLTSFDLKEIGFVDEIILEGKEEINENFSRIIEDLKKYIEEELNILSKKDSKTLIQNRYEKFRKVGAF